MKNYWTRIFGLASFCLMSSLASAQVCQFNTSNLLGQYAFVANQFGSVPFNPPGTTGIVLPSPYSPTPVGNFLSGIDSGRQFAVLGLVYFDGSGAITATPSPTTTNASQIGTYTINSDCSVTVVLNDAFGSPSNLPTTFVGAILGNDQEIDFNNFVTTVGNAGISGLPNGTGPFFKLVKVQNRNFCSVSSLTGLYGFVVNTSTVPPSTVTPTSGIISSAPNPATVVGYLNFDGSGKINANSAPAPTDKSSTAAGVNALQRSLQYSGTYTVNPDCTGSMAISNATSLAGATGNTGTTAQSFIISFVELGGSGPTLSPFTLPELILTISVNGTVGAGYAIAQ
jgi:hypothetical protein